MCIPRNQSSWRQLIVPIYNFAQLKTAQLYCTLIDTVDLIRLGIVHTGSGSWFIVRLFIKVNAKHLKEAGGVVVQYTYTNQEF